MSARESVDEALRQIAAVDPELRATTEILAEEAKARAAELDARRARGESVGPLAGVPFTLKDNIAKRGTFTTAGSRILEGYRSPFDATVVERLEAAGAI